MEDNKIRAVAILIKKDKILLIHRTQDGKEFWIFPGGTVEKGEKVEETVIREIEEETCIKCKIVKLIYTHIFSDVNQKQYFYLCEHISGIPKLDDFNELQTMKDKDETYRPKWVDIKELSKILLYPLEIRDWIIEDIKNNFKNIPKTVTLKTSKLRQKI